MVNWKEKTKISKGFNNIFRILTHFYIRRYAIPNLREAVQLHREVTFS